MSIPQLQSALGELNRLNQLPFNPNNRLVYPTGDITFSVQTRNATTGSLVQTPTVNITDQNGQAVTNTTAIPLITLNTFDENVKPIFLANFTYVSATEQNDIEILLTFSSTEYPEVNGRQILYLIEPPPTTASNLTLLETRANDSNTKITAVQQTVNSLFARQQETATLTPDRG